MTAALDAYDRFVKDHAEDRQALDAMVSAHRPEAREKYDLASRQIIFKGMSQFKGVAMESSVGAVLLHPSTDGQAVDRATLMCELGLRRSRPDARIVIGVGTVAKSDASMMTLEGRPCEAPLGTFLPQFCTSPLPRFEAHMLEGMLFHFIAGQDVGMRSAVDLVTAERRNKVYPLYWENGAPRYRGPSYGVDTPGKRLTIDLFVHRDVYPGIQPQLWMYDTAVRGLVREFNDPSREHDKIPTRDALHELHGGLAGARLPHVPRYTEMLEHVYGTLGWNAAEFRGYRLDVRYPPYGAQYMMGFKLPEQ